MSIKMMAVGFFGFMMIVRPTASAQTPAVPVNGCLYDGKVYPPGTSINNICIDITCEEEGSTMKWTTTEKYSPCCARCHLYNDPHISTFDNYNYDWHGPCNYSISQQGFSSKEKFGIYGQFDRRGGAAYVETTTFTDNPNTVIEINHTSLATVTVNGASYTVNSAIDGLPVSSTKNPVLAWTSNGCNMFLGSQGFLLMTCQDQMFVWAHPKLVRQVNGLCGHFSFDQTDDFTDRTKVVKRLEFLPFAFPTLWMTAQQPKKDCKRKQTQMGDACKGGDKARDMKSDECKSLLQEVKYEDNAASDATLNQAVRDCATDLCNLEENGAKEDAINEWKMRMQIILANTIQIETKTNSTSQTTRR